MPKSKFKCSICGKITSGRLPKNGDGSFWYPRRHYDKTGILCLGNIQEAIVVDIKNDKP